MYDLTPTFRVLNDINGYQIGGLSGVDVVLATTVAQQAQRVRDLEDQIKAHLERNNTTVSYIRQMLMLPEDVDADTFFNTFKQVFDGWAKSIALTAERDRLRAALIQAIYMRGPYIEHKTGDPFKDGLREYMNQMEVDALYSNPVTPPRQGEDI